MEALQEGWNSCKAQDDAKHSLITDLFTYADRQSALLADAEAELRDKKDVIKLTRTRVDELEMTLRELQLEKDQLGFVIVVVDGDCMPFQDEFVGQGIAGGKTTASLLKRSVEEELKGLFPSQAHHLQVVIRIFANMKGLAKTYRDLDILPESIPLDEFVRGFNMGDALCDFIDAGNGKECSDEKVKGTIRHCLADTHCRQILFGGSADSGYARLLGPYSENEEVRERIALLRGPPFAHELMDIKDRFHTISLDTIFRTQKLPSLKHRVSARLTPPPAPPMGYAMTVSRAPSSPAPTPAARPGSAPGEPQSASVLRNSQGQRVDSQLVYSKQDWHDMKNRKLCNSFHLLGKCLFLDNYKTCSHNHATTLTQRQMTALRAVARMSPCQFGLGCSEPDCICGHRCTRDSCDVSACRFPQEMHNVDVKVVT